MATQITVNGSYREADGSAARGTIEFRLSTELFDTAGNLVASKSPITVLLDNAGDFSVALYATDDPGTTPTGAYYISTFQPENGNGRDRDIREFELASASTPVRFEDQVEVAAGTPGVIGNFVPVPAGIGDLEVPIYDADTDTWSGTTLEPGGVTDHGALDGLADDDHTLYALADGSRGTFASAAQGALADSATQPADLGTAAALDAGSAGGVAELDGTGKVPSAQLPAFVDDVVEAANFAALPGTGESGKIYVTIDDGLTFRWSGSAYVEISASLALGETSTTAYRGDRGKTAYDHSQVSGSNPHSTPAAAVPIVDAGGLITATDVEGALQELAVPSGTSVPKSLIDAVGDLIVGSADDTVARLPKGSALQLLRVNAAGTALEYATPPRRIEQPMTFNPLQYTGVTNVATANMAHYFRIQNDPGPFAITKIGLWVGVASGNICVSVLRGTNGVNGPSSRVATSGSVACPTAGYAEVTLSAGVTVDPLTDWFGISADNTTATFGRIGGAPATPNNFGRGTSYYEASAFPIPSTPTPITSWRAGFILVGVA